MTENGTNKSYWYWLSEYDLRLIVAHADSSDSLGRQEIKQARKELKRRGLE